MENTLTTVITNIDLDDSKCQISFTVSDSFPIIMSINEKGEVSFVESDKNISQLNGSFRTAMRKVFKDISNISIDKVQLLNSNDPDICKFEGVLFNEKIKTFIDTKFAVNFNELPIPFSNSTSSLYFKTSFFKNVYHVLRKNRDNRQNPDFGVMLSSLQINLDTILSNRFLHWFLNIQVMFTLLEKKEEFKGIEFKSAEEKVINDQTVYVTSKGTLNVNTMNFDLRVSVKIGDQLFSLTSNKGEMDLSSLESILQITVCESCILTNIDIKGVETDGLYYFWDEERKKVVSTIAKDDYRSIVLSNKPMDIDLESLIVDKVYSPQEMINSITSDVLSIMEDPNYEI